MHIQLIAIDTIGQRALIVPPENMAAYMAATFPNDEPYTEFEAVFVDTMNVGDVSVMVNCPGVLCSNISGHQKIFMTDEQGWVEQNEQALNLQGTTWSCSSPDCSHCGFDKAPDGTITGCKCNDTSGNAKCGSVCTTTQRQ